MGLSEINKLYIDSDELAKLVSGVGTSGVLGPASAIDGNIAVFDGETGKLIKDSGFAVSEFATNYMTYIQGLTLPYSITTSWSVLLDATDYATVFQDCALALIDLSFEITSVSPEVYCIIRGKGLVFPYKGWAVSSDKTCEEEFQMHCESLNTDGSTGSPVNQIYVKRSLDANHDPILMIAADSAFNISGTPQYFRIQYINGALPE